MITSFITRILNSLIAVPSVFFYSILKSVAVPIVSILVLQYTFLGLKGAFLAVVITLTIVNIFSVIILSLRLMTHALMLRTNKMVKVLVRISIEVLSVVAFWLIYLVYIQNL